MAPNPLKNVVQFSLDMVYFIGTFLGYSGKIKFVDLWSLQPGLYNLLTKILPDITILEITSYKNNSTVYARVGRFF